MYEENPIASYIIHILDVIEIEKRENRTTIKLKNIIYIELSDDQEIHIQ